ncbi:MAG: hypothetical protein R2695_02870 [Acidimicrobiales bacterium]
MVITYADDPGYNHPDHLQAHRITVAAVEQSAIPAKLYFIARRRSDWERLFERLRARGVDLPARPAPDPETMRKIVELEARITTSVDVSEFVATKRDALAAHASQIDESWFSQLPEDVFGDVFGFETFVRAHDTSGAPVPESDLFAGLH